jgi:hypothetical protein
MCNRQCSIAGDGDFQSRLRLWVEHHIVIGWQIWRWQFKPADDWVAFFARGYSLGSKGARRADFVRSGSSQIQRPLRWLRVLTQGVPRGPRGTDEPRAIAKSAGCDGNWS